MQAKFSLLSKAKLHTFKAIEKKKEIRYKMQKQHPKPLTSSELLETTNQLIASVKTLEKEFENFLSDKEIGDDVEKLIECQNQFWNESVSRLIDEVTQDEADCVNNVDRCILLWDNCFFTRFYNETIFVDWSDLELRKLTILLGIHNLKKLNKSRAIEIEPKTSDEESESDTDTLTSQETSNSSENSSSEIGLKAASDCDGENDDESDSKTPRLSEPRDLSQNSQTGIRAETSDEGSEESDEPEESDDEMGNIKVLIYQQSLSIKTYKNKK